MWYTQRGLFVLKRFVVRFAASSAVLFFFIYGDLSVTNGGTETFCFAALEVKYSKMRAVGLYFLTANFESAAEISFFLELIKIKGTICQRNRFSFVLRQDGLFKIRDLRRDAFVDPLLLDIVEVCACDILRKTLMSRLKEVHQS
jgi:hypothetical protein